VIVLFVDIGGNTNKTDGHDISEILLKVALDTITPLNSLNTKKDHDMMH
jgi:hypothetical protein